MKKENWLWTTIVILWLISGALSAATPAWTYSAPTPSQLSISKTGVATVQYTVTNQSRKTKSLFLKTTPGLSASSCYLAGKGSKCILTLTINGGAIQGPGLYQGPILCEQNNSNQCYQPSRENQLNVTVENKNSSLVAYISSISENGIFRCEIASNGNLINCSPEQLQISPSFSLLINPLKNFLYAFSPSIDSYYKCNILQDGSLINCIVQPLIDKPIAMAINARLNLGYVITGDDGVQICVINPEGILNSCIQTLTSEANLSSIQIDKEAKWVYITQGENSVLKCAVNSDGGLGNCSRTGPVLEVSFMSLNTSGTSAYISDLMGNQVLRCNIMVNGEFNNCISTGEGFNGPSNIGFNSSGNVAYIANLNSNTISQCAIDAQGLLNGCIATGSNLVGPLGLAIY